MPGAVVAWRGPVMLGRGDIGGLRNILLNTKSPSARLMFSIIHATISLCSSACR
jgi:hypothetical protein